MQRRALCQLWLTCEDEQEAYRIAAALLEARLIVCSKTMPLAADYWWKGAMNHANEVLMVMDSSLELFDEVEAVVKQLHSYDVYVLQAMPLLRMSHDAEQWLMSELKGGERSDDTPAPTASRPSVATSRPNLGNPPIGMPRHVSEPKPFLENDRSGAAGTPAVQDLPAEEPRHEAQAPSPARKGTRINIQ